MANEGNTLKTIESGKVSDFLNDINGNFTYFQNLLEDFLENNQLRKITIKNSEEPSKDDGVDGDIWIVYEADEE